MMSHDHMDTKFLLLMLAVLFEWPVASSMNKNSNEVIFRENLEIKNKVISNSYLVAKVKLRSKIECAVHCKQHADCWTTLFEKTGQCFMYSETVTGGCNGSLNVKYFTRTDKRSSWMVVLIEVVLQKIHVFHASDGTWLKTIKTSVNMVSLNVDPKTWQAYWIDRLQERLMTSNLKGKNRKTLLSGVETYQISLDTLNRRIFFCDHSYGKKSVGFLDLDEGGTTVITNNSCKHVAVSPDSRLIYWIGKNGLMRKHYDKTDAIKIKSYSRTCFAFTIDQTDHKLIWISSESDSYIVWSDMSGENQKQVKMSQPLTREIFDIVSWNSNIYMTDPTSGEIKVYNCKGERRVLSPSSPSELDGMKSVLMLPEHVFLRELDDDIL